MNIQTIGPKFFRVRQLAGGDWEWTKPGPGALLACENPHERPHPLGTGQTLRWDSTRRVLLHLG